MPVYCTTLTRTALTNEWLKKGGETVSSLISSFSGTLTFLTGLITVILAISGWLISRHTRQAQIDESWQKLNLELMKSPEARRAMFGCAEGEQPPEFLLRRVVFQYQVNILHNIWVAKFWIRQKYYEPIFLIHLRNVYDRNYDLFCDPQSMDGYEREFLEFLEDCVRQTGPLRCQFAGKE